MGNDGSESGERRRKGRTREWGVMGGKRETWAMVVCG